MSKPKKRFARKPAEPHRGIPPQVQSEPGTAPFTREGGASQTHLFVVGLGASAGGLEALQRFLSAVRSDCGMAFVVVTHQHPEAPTLLPELLAKHSQVPVTVITENLEPQPNHVYVAPPGPPVTFEGGRFHFGEAKDHVRASLPIDHFFRSLAREFGEEAVAVVLSGTGTDGTLGASAVKAAGGLVLAQDTGSARFSGMPSSAAATRLVDGVLPPEQMPAELSRLLSRRQKAPGPSLDSGAAVDRLLQTLRRHTGHDFASYKKSTLLRRIERRMNARAVGSVDEYCQLLERDHEETQVLFREFLISVTGFFRDPEVFIALRAELRAVLEAHDPEVTFRAWIPACATGEEAYSIAITLTELLLELGRNQSIQVFATDLDAQAVDAARVGSLPAGHRGGCQRRAPGTLLRPARGRIPSQKGDSRADRVRRAERDQGPTVHQAAFGVVSKLTDLPGARAATPGARSVQLCPAPWWPPTARKLRERARPRRLVRQHRQEEQVVPTRAQQVRSTRRVSATASRRLAEMLPRPRLSGKRRKRARRGRRACAPEASGPGQRAGDRPRRYLVFSRSHRAVFGACRRRAREQPLQYGAHRTAARVAGGHPPGRVATRAGGPFGSVGREQRWSLAREADGAPSR